jgi:hypothetical protein
MFLGFYAYLLPLLLYVLWSTLALWDLGQRDELSTTAVWIWALSIFALPFVAALGYLLFGSARLGPRVKLLALGGGAAYLLIIALGSSVGGIS